MPTRDTDMVDLTTLLPENFADMTWMQQINQKKKCLESFNNELVKLVPRKKDILIKQKDYQ